MMMMGYAYQKGLLPLSAAAIEQAIEVNGVAIKMNTQAFRLGRLAAADPARLAAMMKGQDETVAPKTLDAMSLDEIIAHRSALLTDYQNDSARRALSRSGRAGARCRAQWRLWRGVAARGRDQLRQAARLQGRVRGGAALYRRPLRKADPRPVRRRLQDQLQPRAADPGRRQGCAGTAEEARVRSLADAGIPAAGEDARICAAPPFDIFGHSADRRLERDLIAGYEKDVAHVLDGAVAADAGYRDRNLSLPDRIRGFGPVKEKSVQDAKARYAQLAADLANPPPAPRQIAAE